MRAFRSLWLTTFKHGSVRVSILLTVVASSLWAITLFRLALTGLPADDMGYIHTLPAIFWVAITLLTFASAMLWRDPHDHTGLLAFQSCLFIAMFWLTPLILGNTLFGMRTTYGLHSLTQYIVRFGRLDPISQWYHSWPAFNLLDTYLLELTGIKNYDQVLIWATAAMQFLVVLPLYAFFRHTMGRGNYAWASVWLFILLNWTAQTYFSAQGLGLFFLWTLMFVILWSNEKAHDSMSARLITILLFAGLTITHALTSIAALFIIIVLTLITRRRNFALVLMASIFIAVWSVYGATRFFNSDVPAFFEKALRFDLMLFQNLGQAYTGSRGHLAVVNTRVWFTLAAGIVALGGLASIRKVKNPLDRTIIVMGIGVVLMLPFYFYGGEFFMRVFIYVLPILIYFIVKLLRTNAALILILLVLVALPFGVISLHGNATFDNATPRQRAYWHFVEDKTSEGNFALSGLPSGNTFGYSGLYSVGTFGYSVVGEFAVDIPWQENLETNRWVNNSTFNYIAITGFEYATYALMRDQPQADAEMRIWLNSSRGYILIYTNGEATGYFFEGSNQ